MTKLKVVILISALLLTGCSSKDEQKSEVFKDNAIARSTALMGEEKFSEAREILAFLKDEKYQVPDNLIGQLDNLLLAEECYEAEKYEEASVKIDNIFKCENINGDIVKRANYIKSQIDNAENLNEENIKEENNNDVALDTNIDGRSSQVIEWDNVNASSYLKQDYRPKQVTDGDPTTAWIEDGVGEASNGVGEYIELVNNHILRIDKIEMMNGFSKTYDIYKRNNRINGIRIEFYDPSGNNVKTMNHNFMDWELNYQTIEIPGGVQASSMKIFIESIYNEEATDNDTCISEIITYGEILAD